MWVSQTGRVISAPQAEREQLERAKEQWPSGDWEKTEKKKKSL